MVEHKRAQSRDDTSSHPPQGLPDIDQSGAVYDSLIAHSLQGIVLHQHGRRILVNAAFANMVGHSIQELLDQTESEIQTMIHPEDRERLVQLHRDRDAGKPVPNRYQYRYVRPDGGTVWCEALVSTVNHHGEPASLGFYVDITKRKQVEHEVLTRARQQEAIAALGKEALSIRQPETLMNRAVRLIADTLQVDFCKLLELQPDGRNLRLIAGVGWRPGLVGTALVSTNTKSQAGYTLLTSMPVVVEDLALERRFSAPPILIEHNIVSGMSITIPGESGPYGVLGVHSTTPRSFTANDIHFLQAVTYVLAEALRRARMEKELDSSHQQLALIIDNLPGLLGYVDRQQRFIYVNDAYADWYGRDKEELVGRHLQDVLAPDSYRGALPHIKKALQGQGCSFENVAYDDTGRLRTVRASYAPHKDAAGDVVGYVGVVEDITERKQAETTLRNSERRYRELVDLSPVGIITMDRNGVIASCNPAFCELSGYDRSEIVKRHFARVPTLYLADMPRYLKLFSELLRGATAGPIEFRWKRKDGSLRWAEARAGRIQLGNSTTGLQVLISDITERKRIEEGLQAHSAQLAEMVEVRTRELREAQEQLVRSEKLAVLGQLAGSVGHELRNPLGVISNAIYFLRMVQPDAGDTVREYLDIVGTEVYKAEKIVSDLLDFGRLKEPDREPIQVASLIADTLASCSLPDNIRVRTQMPDDLPALWVDGLQIQQVLVNLVTNAYQAMPGGGQVSISAQAADDQILISVQDTGQGIVPEHLSKIFEPLFTTKARGIGLGLALSKNLIEANGGQIQAHSHPGEGATFVLTLPQADRKHGTA